MTERNIRHLWLAAFLLLCAAGPLWSGWQVRDWGDALSPVDAFSEANALREVDGFRANGLWHDSGLGNVLFGSRHREVGFTAPTEDIARSVAPGGVYTHYPPGPEYLLYFAEALFGPEPVARLRLVPLAFALGACIAFGMSLRGRLGPRVGWIVMAACLCAPPFSDAAASIHFIGYALALLLLQIAAALGRRGWLGAFLLLGFLQGWMSFDYVFLVVGSPLAVELVLKLIRPEQPIRLRLAVLRCMFAGAGFAAAHALHFAEVWSYYGTISQALQDFRDSARYRSGAEQVSGTQGYLTKAIAIVLYYTVSPFPVSVPLYRPDAGYFNECHIFRFLGLTLGAWWPLATLGVYVAQRLSPGRRLLLRWLGVCAVALGISCLWWLAMQNHAIVHVHLLYRHLILGFILATLFLAVMVTDLARQTSGRPGIDCAP